ncbi:MAG: hypothetical protein QOH03_3189 [Kribbellaceae bacterium]|jgi:hypothetical protein|nr:hypothetical protein [Kribbellaceae bacterium]
MEQPGQRLIGDGERPAEYPGQYPSYPSPWSATIAPSVVSNSSTWSGVRAGRAFSVVASAAPAGQAWSVGMIHSSPIEAWRGRVTM